METEFENLSQLLEAISLTKDAEKNLADAQEEFNAAETTENKNTAQEKVVARTRELAVQKERTNLLRQSVRTLHISLQDLLTRRSRTLRNRSQLTRSKLSHPLDLEQ